MPLDNHSSLPPKRRRFIISSTDSIDSMELESSKIRNDITKENYGRELRVFETVALTSPSIDVPEDETDAFYEFTREDYYRLLGTKREGNYLKTKKIRDAEAASRRSKLTKSVIRIRFPDNHTLEAVFHPSETLESLFDLTKKVIAQPESPFHLFTTPPKKQIKDLTQDFYSAGFVPGAIVYFSYDLPQGNDAADLKSFSYLRDEILQLKNLETEIPVAAEQAEMGADEAPPAAPSASQVLKPVEKKPAKPKWFKM